MSHRPYPDVDRALRQLDRHVPGSLRDPHAYEPKIYRVAELEQLTTQTSRISPEVQRWQRPVSCARRPDRRGGHRER